MDVSSAQPMFLLNPVSPAPLPFPTHPQPLFLYVAEQAVHSSNDEPPLQVPWTYEQRVLHIKDPGRRKFAGNGHVLSSLTTLFQFMFSSCLHSSAFVGCSCSFCLCWLLLFFVACVGCSCSLLAAPVLCCLFIGCSCPLLPVYWLLLFFVDCSCSLLLFIGCSCSLLPVLVTPVLCWLLLFFVACLLVAPVLCCLFIGYSCSLLIAPVLCCCLLVAPVLCRLFVGCSCSLLPVCWLLLFFVACLLVAPVLYCLFVQCVLLLLDSVFIALAYIVVRFLSAFFLMVRYFMVSLRLYCGETESPGSFGLAQQKGQIKPFVNLKKKR